MSDMKCPFCQQELKCWDTPQNAIYSNWSCPNCRRFAYGNKLIWQELTHTRKALEEISSHYQDEMGKPTFVDWYLTAKKMCDCADKALETIGKHKEQIC